MSKVTTGRTPSTSTNREGYMYRTYVLLQLIGNQEHDNQPLVRIPRFCRFLISDLIAKVKASSQPSI